MTIFTRRSIPTYDQAITALHNGDDETVTAALFALNIEDGYYIERVTQAVRGLLQRPDLTPSQIVAIGRALHGLERMPLRTPGVDVHLSLVIKGEDAAESYDLYLSAERFATESGGYANFGFGSDSFSGETFAVEVECREYEGWDIITESWPNVFIEMTAAELEIEDDSDDNLLDWEHPDASRFWEWISDHER